MVNPLVSWLWIATVIMTMGGLMALFSSRRAAQAVEATRDLQTEAAR
jgi:cytochrome c biogenesis factor